ncbi:MAG: hypothetical protein ACFFAM_09335 [Promethearchaeota archaeon]
MRSISPSLIKEFMFCPQAFLYRKVHRLSLIPPMEINEIILAQERVDRITEAFFSILKTHWHRRNDLKTQFNLNSFFDSMFSFFLKYNTQDEVLTYQELGEKVFTLLSWLVQYLWTINVLNDKIPQFLPIMVNHFIQAPSIYLQGRPSAVFKIPKDSVLILIQTYSRELPHTRDQELLQASIYARILETMGLKAQNFLYINYCTMSLVFQELKHVDFLKMEISLSKFRSNLDEGNFDPPNNPPCDICEFNCLCDR